MRVIIADQQVDVREALQLLLEESQGIRDIRLTAHPAELLDLLCAEPAEVLLLDWDFFTSDSTLIGQIRGICPDIRVVILSARPEARIMALEAGADAFVSKGDPAEFVIDALYKRA